MNRCSTYFYVFISSTPLLSFPFFKLRINQPLETGDDLGVVIKCF